MNLIIPAAGKSSRFQTRPKWLLTQPNGNIMLYESFQGLKGFDNLYITILKEHFDKYLGDKKVLDKKLKNIDYHLLILDNPTDSQCETIYQTINHFKINGPIFIKDCDNYFEHQLENKNHICYLTLNKEIKNIIGKSYIQNNQLNEVINIVEKNIISNKFCVGGYGFKNAKDYSSAFEFLNQNNIKYELYTSHIINYLLKENIFLSTEVSSYLDWGTYEEWIDYKNSFKTLFIDIDGVLIENSGEEGWGLKNGIKKNIDFINSLKNTQIILTTARKEEYKEITKKQLNENNIKYDQLIMGLNHCKRYLINDYSRTNPYPSAIAINLERDNEKLEDLLNNF